MESIFGLYMGYIYINIGDRYTYTYICYIQKLESFMTT